MKNRVTRRPMNNEKWNSTPSFFGEYRKLVGAAAFFVGLIVLFISIYVLATEISFFRKASTLDATIVEVRREPSSGSVFAYFPVVEIPNSRERISVNTSDHETVYSVGNRMSVLCDLSVSMKCIRNRFLDKWWGLVDLSIALLLLVPSSLYLRRSRSAMAGFSVE